MATEVATGYVSIVPSLSGFGAALTAGVNSAVSGAGAAAAANLSKQLTGIGAGLSKSVTLPIVGIGVAATAMAVEFETSLSKMQGLVGLTGDEIAAMEGEIKSLASTYGASATEAADAMFFITSAGLRGADAMSVLEASLKGSAIGLGDVKTIADLSTSAMNAYGPEVLSASQATDTLTAAVREGKLEADTLAGAVGRTLPIASAMGIEFSEVAAAFAAMSRTGTDANEAATQLRGIMTAILQPTAEAEAALAAMGLSAEGLRTQLREQGLLSTLQTLSEKFAGNEEAAGQVFGNVRALSGVMDLMGANAATTEQIFGNLANTTGMVDEAFASTSETTGFQAKQAFESLKNSLISFGDAIAPVVSDIAGIVEKVAAGFEKLPGPVKTATVVAGALAAAMGPLLFISGKLISVFLTLRGVILGKTAAMIANRIAYAAIVGYARAYMLVSALLNANLIRQAGAWVASTAAMVANRVAMLATNAAMLVIRGAVVAWTAVQWALNAALLANPLVLIVVAIVALIAVIVLAYQKSETFRNIVQAVWEGIKTAISTAVEFIKKVISVWLTLLVAYFKFYWNLITTVIGFVWSVIKSTVQGGVDFVKNVINTLSAVLDAVKQWFSKMADGIGQQMERAKEAVGNVVNGIKDFFSNARTWLVDAGKNIIQGLIDGIQSMLGAAGNAVSGIVSSLNPFGRASEGEVAVEGTGRAFTLSTSSLSLSRPVLAPTIRGGDVGSRVQEIGKVRREPVTRVNVFVDGQKQSARVQVDPWAPNVVGAGA